MIILVIALLIFLFGVFCYWLSQILQSIDEKLGNIESLLKKKNNVIDDSNDTENKE